MSKRVFDVVLGSFLLAAAAPIILVLALALAVELRANPFFLQKRIGQGGREQLFLKLRTLPTHTPKYALKHDFEMELSRFRAFLRKRHIDELPQLLHVAMGHMSLVGPRPRMPDAHEPVDPYYARRRVEVPQGCTGLWQIGAHYDGLPSEAPEYDLFYVNHANLALDLWILWHTFLKLIGKGRAVMIADIPPALLGSVPVTIDLADVPSELATTSG